jgi:biotin operon repressor
MTFVIPVKPKAHFRALIPIPERWVIEETLQALGRIGKEGIIMQNILALNELYHQYVKGDLGRKEFEGVIFRIILKNIQYFYFADWDREEYIDYLCWLYPRLSNAIDNYREKGYSFSTHIIALVRYSVKEYRSRQADHYITEFAAWTVHAADMEVHSREAEYLPEPAVKPPAKPAAVPTDLAGRPARPVPGYPAKTAKFPPEKTLVNNPRQILLLLLKSYYFVSDDFLERVAPAIGVETEKLREMIEKLRNWRTRREETIRILQERIVCQFYRCIVVEKRLRSAAEGSARYEKLAKSLKGARERLTSMRKRLSGIRVDATNQQVADLLGITKGAVASNLHALRNRYRQPDSGDLCPGGDRRKKHRRRK